ncbi:hypothetical protein [Cohnella nanjingensis]|uniref:DUF4432 family protein n=1 Tax=Cohnella nanjingensis TaxID=1387779 RepID=A0A7X0RNK8_9BACL|nr:hypothetical protein [Cohnella nanjingensis]MBB6670787.1 hypothetical protein [Cohnella nanjingensis]
MQIYRSCYKDIDAVTIENDALSAQFLPDYGGKMASFASKATRREFLVQAGNERYRALEYDGDYVASECSGFDDMFPTIDRCPYPDVPWRGVVIPDHGEVCGLKWEQRIENGGEALLMFVHGVRFPYRLEKRIAFVGERTLGIDYRAVNLSGFDMHFLWAAHPMIAAEPGGTIETPFTGERDVAMMFSTDAKHGQTADWPAVLDDTEGAAYKFYFRDRVPVGRCAYRYPSGEALVLEYSAGTVPYLGIWVNNGSFKGYRNVAFEMCTGAMDRPDAAIAAGQSSVLPANGEYRWHLRLSEEIDGGLTLGFGATRPHL